MKLVFCTIAILLAGCASPPRPVSQADIAPLTPAEMLLDKQMVAYNNHDVEALVAMCAPDVRVYMHPNELKSSGQEELRQAYIRLFAKAPKVRGIMKRRIAQGNFVVDEEQVTGLPDGSEPHAIGIYEVRDQRIVAVWFIR